MVIVKVSKLQKIVHKQLFLDAFVSNVYCTREDCRNRFNNIAIVY